MDPFTRLTRDFFVRDTQIVAKDIIGRYLVREIDTKKLIGKIIEIEAYLGPKDKACHAYNNRKTEKTKIMYEKPGTLYVYYIYGMYFCLNIITEPEGVPCAVFIRQLSPIEGIDEMIKNRNVKIGKNFKNLVDGPSKICSALKITKAEFNGKDSCAYDSKLYIMQGEFVNEKDIVLGKRVGVDYAEEDKELLLRFTLKKI